MPANVGAILVSIILYLVMMVAIGLAFSKKNKDTGDFYLGGRKLGPIVAAMSAEASDMSSWLLMGLPGVAYLAGCAEASWTAIGLAVGTYLNWLLMAKRLRTYSARLGAITLPSFFSKRYHDDKNIISAVSALIILIFFIPYTASGFSACGRLFNTLFGIEYHTAMIISAIVIILYTSTGGFLAASTTDLIQSIVMTTALVILVIFGVSTAGGLGDVIENAKSLTGYLSLTQNHVPADNSSTPFSFLSIVSTMAWGLGYFGMPHILLRFMAIEDHKKIAVSRRIGSIWVVISMGIAIFIGLIGNALTADGIIPVLEDSAASETVVIKIAEFLAGHSILAAILAGIIFAGILACTMSTSDSQLLAASSSMSEDILQGFFKKDLDQKQQMITARVVLAVIAILSVLIAWDPNSSIFRVVSFAWAGFGATFGPLMLISLFWKRANKQGAIAGLVAGGLTVFIWKFLIAPIGGVFGIYELLPAFIVSTVFTVVVSLCTAPPEDEIIKEFEMQSKEG